MKRRDHDAAAALIDAARRCFAERGYDGATAQAIAARAGVSASAVNYHFQGKDGLYRTVLDAALENPTAIESDDPIVAGLTAMFHRSDDGVRARLLAWEAMRPTRIGAAAIIAARRREEAQSPDAPLHAHIACLWTAAMIAALDPANPFGRRAEMDALRAQHGDAEVFDAIIRLLRIVHAFGAR